MNFAAIRIALWLGGFLALVILLLMLLGGYLWYQSRKMPSGRPEYVAMGSSFAAGPGIPTRTRDSPSFCSQSDQNYAHQFAKLKHLALIDMSCGGATSEHILHGGQIFQGAQLRPITGETRLVTITIGGNDISYLGNLIALGCGQDTSLLFRLVACKPTTDEAVDAGFEHLAVNMEAIGKEIHRRSPKARIVLVAYPAILPPKGTCPRLGLSPAAADKMRFTAARLDAALHDAARAMNAELLDAALLTHDHDACAADPWVTSAHPGGLSAPLHPNLAGMTAIARALEVQ